MNKNAPHSIEEPEIQLYLLAWHDTLERLDILISEIRNLQTNIIYTLREPFLYSPLRHEEYHLWGYTSNEEEKKANSPEQEIKECCKKLEDDNILAARWVVYYPSFTAQPPEEENIKKNNSKCFGVYQKLLDELEPIWLSNAWGRTQRRYYHQLRSLQVLKSQLVRDRITLCRHAFDAGLATPQKLIKNSYGKEEQLTFNLGRFMLARSAVTHRLKTFITRFRNHQQQFGKSFDTSYQDHPRPYVERRRDMSRYMDFLSDRTREIRRYMNLFFDDIEIPKSKRSGENLILHGWTHNPQAKIGHLQNATGTCETTTDKNNNLSIDYVNTNFYSPDRPDLQPAIAHEVAHTIIRDRLYNLSTTRNDSFSRLIENFEHYLGGFMKNHPNPYIKKYFNNTGDNQIRDRLIELACDLLATTVKGPSYVYALFLETSHAHMEQMLLSVDNTQPGDIDLRLIDNPKELHDAYLSTRNIDWYYRLRLTVSLMKNYNHLNARALEKRLFEGIESVCDRLLDFLDLIKHPTDVKEAHLWRKLGDELWTRLDKSGWSTEVKKWRQKCSEDSFNENKNKKGDRNLPRSTRRLADPVRELLYSKMIYHKTRPGKPLSDIAQQDSSKWIIPENGKCFNEKFFDTYIAQEITNDNSWCPKPLFRHLYDISYMSALIRSQDLITSKQDSVYPQLISDMSLGRDSYQLAIEFGTHDLETANQRLNTVVALIDNFIKREGQPESTSGQSNIFLKLQKWLYGKSSTNNGHAYRKNLREEANSLSEELENSGDNPRQYVKKKSSGIVSRYGTVTILYTHNKTKTQKVRRAIERLSGLCLEILVHDYLKWDEISSKKWKILLAPLHFYLMLRDNRTYPDPEHEDNNATSLFHDTLTQVIGQEVGSINDKDSNPLPLKNIPIWLISRLSFTSPNTLFSPLLEKTKKRDVMVYRAAIDGKFSGHYDIYPYEPDKTHSSQNQAVKTHIHLLSGRYDALSLMAATPPCFCPIPYIEKAFTSEKNNARKDKKADADTDENFPVFFGQKEAAVALRLHWDPTKEEHKAEIDPKRFFAFISVSLTHRAQRLDLIYRLLLAQQAKTEDGIPNKIIQQYYEDLFKISGANGNANSDMLETLVEHIKPGDYAFLTDSWEDIIFAFTLPKTEDDKKDKKHDTILDRLPFIYKFQNALYEDFLVDRTEIMLSAECINAIAKANKNKHSNNKYTLSYRVRVAQDRHLLRSNNELKKRIQKKLKESELQLNNLSRIPGRMDFSLDIDLSGYTGDNLLQGLFGLIDEEDDIALVDRADTSIGHIEIPAPPQSYDTFWDFRIHQNSSDKS